MLRLSCPSNPSWPAECLCAQHHLSEGCLTCGQAPTVPALQVAFVRDITAYIGASCLVLAFLWDGWLSLAESLVLVLLYIGYVVIACYTST